MSRGRLSLLNIEIVFWQNALLANLKTYYVLWYLVIYPCLCIDFCYTWIPSLAHVHPKSILLDLAKHCFSIIWRSSKKMNFPKIWRLWLKNCARHAHFNFELLKGVAVLFSELCPSNLVRICFLLSCKNAEIFVVISQAFSDLAKISVSVPSLY